MICSGCDYKKKTPEGMCNIQKGEDGLPVRCVGLWAKNKPKILFKDFKILNGKETRLVERVNDGSIITRFDKTPLPENSTDVICPHFLELKWAYGCPFDCSWCYLKGTFRFRPNGKEPVIKDYAKIEHHTRAFID